MLGLLERSDGATIDVLSGDTDQGTARAAENVNESWSILAILPPCSSGNLDVIAEDFLLILGPRADLLHEEAVVADHVTFGIEPHSSWSDSSCAHVITRRAAHAPRLLVGLAGYRSVRRRQPGWH